MKQLEERLAKGESDEHESSKVDVNPASQESEVESGHDSEHSHNSSRVSEHSEGERSHDGTPSSVTNYGVSQWRKLYGYIGLVEQPVRT